MKTIKAYYLPATNYKGSRIKATSGEHSVTMSYPHELSGVKVYDKAVKELCEKMNWTGTLVSGCYKNEYYYNFIDSDKLTI